jgi:hypothetical protein
MNWIDKWQQGEMENTPEIIDYIKDLYSKVGDILIQLPPSCIVKGRKGANVILHPLTSLSLGVGLYGIITSYFEPCDEYPKGAVSCRSHPEANLRGDAISPDDLEVIGYHKNMTPQWVNNIISNK